MRDTKQQRISRFYERMYELGFTYDEINSLRRIEMTLSRWGERECNGEIERDEKTGKVFSISHPYLAGLSNEPHYSLTADKETGALKRLNDIMLNHKSLWSYYQTDPRGCSLYIGRKADIRKDEKLECVYTRGFGVCY
jgi:hypothetical protein